MDTPNLLMDFFDHITRPTLLLNEAVCRNNIRTMAARAVQHGIALRPHFKTHQSLAIGEWFRAEGTQSIAVSSVAMAEYFAARWDDILVAFPVNLRELDAIRSLADRIRLGVLVSNPAAAQALAAAMLPPLDVWLEVDEGTGRTGFPVDDVASIGHTLQQLGANPALHVRGFLTHAGRTYHCRTTEAVQALHRENLQALARLKDAFPGMALSYGDTPSCSVADTFAGLDELRPGNYVFYDLMQQRIGACTHADIALAVACPLVGPHMLYGGAVHLSKDSIEVDDRPIFGEAVRLTATGWAPFETPWYLTALSQEHGQLDPAHPAAGTLAPGTLLGVLPVHSCLTADLYPCYLTTRGTWLEKFSMKGQPGLHKATEKT